MYILADMKKNCRKIKIYTGTKRLLTKMLNKKFVFFNEKEFIFYN